VLQLAILLSATMSIFMQEQELVKMVLDLLPAKPATLKFHNLAELLLKMTLRLVLIPLLIAEQDQILLSVPEYVLII